MQVGRIVAGSRDLLQELYVPLLDPHEQASTPSSAQTPTAAGTQTAQQHAAGTADQQPGSSEPLRADGSGRGAAETGECTLSSLLPPYCLLPEQGCKARVQLHAAPTMLVDLRSIQPALTSCKARLHAACCTGIICVCLCVCVCVCVCVCACFIGVSTKSSLPGIIGNVDRLDTHTWRRPVDDETNLQLLTYLPNAILAKASAAHTHALPLLAPTAPHGHQHGLSTEHL